MLVTLCSLFEKFLWKSTTQGWLLMSCCSWRILQARIDWFGIVQTTLLKPTAKSNTLNMVPCDTLFFKIKCMEKWYYTGPEMNALKKRFEGWGKVVPWRSRGWRVCRTPHAMRNFMLFLDKKNDQGQFVRNENISYIMVHMKECILSRPMKMKTKLMARKAFSCSNVGTRRESHRSLHQIAS